MLTGPDGRAALPVPEAARGVIRVQASREGWAPVHGLWDLRGEPPPPELVLPMDRALPIGGFTVDGDGVALAGAEVRVPVWTWRGDSAAALPGRHLSARSDGRGFWRIDAAPAAAGRVLLRVSHPDCASERDWASAPDPPLEELRALAPTMLRSEAR